MASRWLLACFILVIEHTGFAMGFCQTPPAPVPAQVGDFPEIVIPGLIFQPLAAAGKNHLLVGGKGPKDTSFRLYDLTTGQKISEFQTQDLQAPIALSPDGKTFAAIPGSLQKDQLVLIDTGTGQTKTTFPIEKVADKIYFLDDQRIATATIWEKTALIWDLNTGKKIAQINFSHAARPGQLPLAFSPDGRKALFLRNNQIHLLQIDTKEETLIGALEQKNPYDQALVGIAFSTDGTEAVFLLESLGKQSLQSWNLQKKTPGKAVEFP